MPIGFHFDDIEREAFGLTDEVYEDEAFDKQIGGLHGNDDEPEDDMCIGGMHGKFCEKDGDSP